GAGLHEGSAAPLINRAPDGSAGPEPSLGLGLEPIHLHPTPAPALRGDDRLEVPQGAFKVIIDDHVVVGRDAPVHLRARAQQTAADGLLPIRAAGTQATGKLLHRRGEDENADRIGVLALDRLAALHVDVEEGDPAGLAGHVDRGLRAAVEVAVNLGPLHELAPLDAPLEGLDVDELVVDAVALGAAGIPGGDAHREVGLRQLLHEPPGEGGLSCPGGRGEEQEDSGRQLVHSTFWTCSRMRSSSALRETTRWAISGCWLL